MTTLDRHFIPSFNPSTAGRGPRHYPGGHEARRSDQACPAEGHPPATSRTSSSSTAASSWASAAKPSRRSGCRLASKPSVTRSWWGQSAVA